MAASEIWKQLCLTFIAVSYTHLDVYKRQVHFLHLAVDMPQIFLLILKVFLGTLHDGRNKSHGDRKYEQRYERHERADAEHHHKHTDDRRHRSDDLRRTLVQTLPECIYIAVSYTHLNSPPPTSIM